MPFVESSAYKAPAPRASVPTPLEPFGGLFHCLPRGLAPPRVNPTCLYAFPPTFASPAQPSSHSWINPTCLYTLLLTHTKETRGRSPLELQCEHRLCKLRRCFCNPGAKQPPEIRHRGHLASGYPLLNAGRLPTARASYTDEGRSGRTGRKRPERQERQQATSRQ